MRLELGRMLESQKWQFGQLTRGLHFFPVLGLDAAEDAYACTLSADPRLDSGSSRLEPPPCEIRHERDPAG